MVDGSATLLQSRSQELSLTGGEKASEQASCRVHPHTHTPQPPPLHSWQTGAYLSSPAEFPIYSQDSKFSHLCSLLSSQFTRFSFTRIRVSFRYEWHWILLCCPTSMKRWLWSWGITPPPVNPSVSPKSLFPISPATWQCDRERRAKQHKGTVYSQWGLLPVISCSFEFGLTL